MTLLIDIGNSTVVVAIADNNQTICNTWRFKTRKEETASFFRTELLAGIRKYNVGTSDIEKVVISSVVPEVNDDISQAINDITGLTPHFFCLADAERHITLNIESPTQLGKDRLADALGAAECYGTPAIVFDMGTATTVGVINEKREFIGGMIIPGVKTSLRALSEKASQLPCIDIEKPRSIVGKNTMECMQSGILYGTASMVDGIIDRIMPMFSSPAHIIATGGMSKTIVPHCRHDIVVDQHLQFKGLLKSCE